MKNYIKEKNGFDNTYEPIVSDISDLNLICPEKRSKLLL